MGIQPDDLRSMRELIDAGLDNASIAAEMKLPEADILAVRLQIKGIRQAKPAHVPLHRRASSIIVDWTEEEITTLKRLVDEDKSTRQIAGVLGRSRNSVIGKIHRLGLPMRKPGGTKAAPPAELAIPKPKRAVEPKAPKAAKESKPAAEKLEGPAFPSNMPLDDRLKLAFTDRAPDGSRGVPIRDLQRERQCVWPIGDLEAIATRFCGMERAHGSYCAHHGRIAYTPPKPSTNSVARSEYSRQVTARKRTTHADGYGL